jgi:zinc transport system substrate-binding protein
VIAGFYPLEFVASRVAGDAVAVRNLVQPGAEAHDLELTPQDVAAVSQADLVVYLSGFQPALDDVVAAEAADRSFDVTGDARLDIGSEMSEHEDDDAHDEDDTHEDDTHEDDTHEDDTHEDDTHEDDTHADDDAHDEDDTHEDDDHADEDGDDHNDEEHDEHGHDDEEHDDHGGLPSGLDPHFWLDPMRLADVATAVAAQLSELSPDDAETFTANADALVADLEALDAEFREGTESCENRTLVTSHEAFAYLSDAYDFTQRGIAGLSPEDEPSARELAELATFVQDNDVTTIYFETLTSPAVAETLAAETGAQTAVLDPIEGLSDASAGADYLEIMRANLESIRTGQPCD